jgi:HSP20 family protein
MSIVRYSTDLDGFVPTTFSQLVDRFFNESVSRSGGSAYSFIPKADIIESEKGFEIDVMMPGMNKEDIKIELKDNQLTVSGERKFLKEKSKDRFNSLETTYGTFSRTFALPDNVDSEKIQARYNNGVLELVVPKDEKKLLKATIKVS